MNITQTASGKSLEYAVALELSKVTGGPLTGNLAVSAPHKAYQHSNEQGRLNRAAFKVTEFLIHHDSQLKNATAVTLQSDQLGQHGDVRDIIVTTSKNEQVGISVKNNHAAIKHSRLSDRIDFGKQWAGCPVSSQYFDQVKPIFSQLSHWQSTKEITLFSKIPNKAASIYLPVLTAFEDELNRLCMKNGELFVSRMFEYLLGTHDFYKVIKCDKDSNVTIQSMNMKGTLGWGRKWKIPNQIESIRRKARSNSTLHVSFAGGWLLSFRLHNARSLIEPSLKFDIQLIGMPAKVSQHQIPLGWLCV